MRVIIRDFVNGDFKSLRELGLEHYKINRVFTLIDLSLLEKEDLEEVKLRHNQNVFLEDRFHDWEVSNGIFKFYGHSGKKGDLHDLLLEVSPL